MMPLPFLAQTPAPSAPSAEFVGFSVLVLIMLTRWLWDYNRNRREEAKDHEPRATPPLHTIYVTKLEHAELKERVEKISDEMVTKAEHSELKDRVEKISDEIKAGFATLAEQRTESITGLHDDIGAKTTALRMEVKGDIKGVHDRMTDVFNAVSKMQGQLEELKKK